MAGMTNVIYAGNDSLGGIELVSSWLVGNYGVTSISGNWQEPCHNKRRGNHRRERNIGLGDDRIPKLEGGHLAFLGAVGGRSKQARMADLMRR